MDAAGKLVIYSRTAGTGVINSFVLQTSTNGNDCTTIPDDHDVPGIMVKSDGRIVAVYSHHACQTIWYRISANPEDVTSWFTERVMLNDGTRTFTYPTPVRLPAESNRTYVMFRDGDSTNSRYHSYLTSNDLDGISTDVAATWSSKVQFLDSSTVADNNNETAYTLVAPKGTDTLYFTFSQHPRYPEVDHNVYSFYYKAGSWYKPDGTLIHANAALPIVTSDLTGSALVYDWTISGNKGWIWDIAVNGSGNPIIAFASFVSDSDHRYNYAVWGGSSWLVNQIAAGGGTIVESNSFPDAEPDYSGGVQIDWNNPQVVYFATNVSGNFIVKQGTTADSGASWSISALTTTGKNFRPSIIHNHDSTFVGFWHSGSYPGFTNYSTVQNAEFTAGTGGSSYSKITFGGPLGLGN